MALTRSLLIAALLTTALVLQVSLLPILPLPGATAPVLSVVVVAIGYAAGSVTGAVAGFAGGLLLDLAPPSVGLLGLSAAVLAVAGALGGEFGQRRDRPAVLTTAIVGLTCGGAVLAYPMLAGIFGDPHLTWDRVPMLVITAAIYGAVLAIFLLPAVDALFARLQPQAGLSGYGVGRLER